MPRAKKPDSTTPRRRHFFREWRKHRKLSLERASEAVGMSRENLGKIERGQVPYDQDWLERLAVVYDCEPVDLITRNPLDAEGPWLIWDKLAEAQRKQALRVLRALAEEDKGHGDKAA